MWDIPPFWAFYFIVYHALYEEGTPDIYNENLHKMAAARFNLKIMYVMNDDFTRF